MTSPARGGLVAGDFVDMQEMRTLRRVVPIARAVVRDGMAVTLIGLDDYTEGFEIRGLLVPPEAHPVREISAIRNRLGQARLRALMEARQPGVDTSVAPMVLRFEPEQPIPDDPDPWSPHLDFTVRDNRGNGYSPRQWGSGGSADAVFHLNFGFTPGLDPEARQVWFEAAEVVWTTLPPRRDDRPPVRIDPGPFVFLVDLTAGRDLVVAKEVE